MDRILLDQGKHNHVIKNYLSDSQSLNLKFWHIISEKTHDLSLIPAGITNSKANSSQYRNKSKFFVKSKEIFTLNRKNIYGSLLPG